MYCSQAPSPFHILAILLQTHCTYVDRWTSMGPQFSWGNARRALLNSCWSLHSQIVQPLSPLSAQRSNPFQLLRVLDETMYWRIKLEFGPSHPPFGSCHDSLSSYVRPRVYIQFTSKFTKLLWLDQAVIWMTELVCPTYEMAERYFFLVTPPFFLDASHTLLHVASRSILVVPLQPEA